MKTNVLRTSILALAFAIAGHAQSTLKLQADIPFNFVVGHATLAAGEYHVEQGNAGTLDIKSVNGKGNAFVFVIGQCAGNQTGSRLVFHRYGDTYLLSQVWTEGERCGRQVPRSSRERELEAKYRAPDETIVLAMR